MGREANAPFHPSRPTIIGASKGEERSLEASFFLSSPPSIHSHKDEHKHYHRLLLSRCDPSPFTS